MCLRWSKTHQCVRLGTERKRRVKRRCVFAIKGSMSENKDSLVRLPPLVNRGNVVPASLWDSPCADCATVSPWNMLPECRRAIDLHRLSDGQREKLPWNANENCASFGNRMTDDDVERARVVDMAPMRQELDIRSRCRAPGHMSFVLPPQMPAELIESHWRQWQGPHGDLNGEQDLAGWSQLDSWVHAVRVSARLNAVWMECMGGD